MAVLTSSKLKTNHSNNTSVLRGATPGVPIMVVVLGAVEHSEKVSGAWVLAATEIHDGGCGDWVVLAAVGAMAVVETEYNGSVLLCLRILWATF